LTRYVAVETGQRVYVVRDGGAVDLPTLAGNQAGASATNGRGQIVGWSEMKRGVEHAVLWTLKRG